MFDDNFHFLRPMMLYFGLVPFVVWFFAKKTGGAFSEWRKACDANLLKHIISKKVAKTGRYFPLFLGAFWFLCVFALAGPASEKLPQPTYKKAYPVSIILDTSYEMAVKDVSPTRLDRAKFKIIDMLKKLKSNPVSLIAYSDEAFVITPFTDDVNVVENLLHAIDFSIMPTSGVRPDRAIEKAVESFESAFYPSGRIYILSASTGEKTGEFIKAVKKAKSKGYKTYVIGVGTTQGAPIVDARGNFVSDGGKTVISKLKKDALQEVARIGSGKYINVNSSDYVLDRIMRFDEVPSELMAKVKQAKAKADVYKDMGVYFMPLILLVAVFAFRKGLIASFVLFFMLSFSGQAMAFSWNDLWLTKDYQAQKLFNEKEYEKAAKTFENVEWKALSNYKNKKFEEAIEFLESKETSQNSDEYLRDNYNLGNAYAFKGDYEKSLKAYEKVLKIQPKNLDAKHNYELVKKLLDNQKKQDNQDKKNNKGGQGKDKKQNNSQQNQQKQSQQNKSQQSNAQQDQSQQGRQNKSAQKNKGDGQNRSEKTEEKAGEKQGEKKASKGGKDLSKKDFQAQKSKMNKNGKEEGKEQNAQLQEQRFYDNKKDWDGKKQKQEQLYGKIPDDAGGLLREMLYRRYQMRQER
jgi:Ca-activated chloride channel family protein